MRNYTRGLRRRRRKAEVESVTHTTKSQVALPVSPEKPFKANNNKGLKFIVMYYINQTRFD